MEFALAAVCQSTLLASSVYIISAFQKTKDSLGLEFIYKTGLYSEVDNHVHIEEIVENAEIYGTRLKKSKYEKEREWVGEIFGENTCEASLISLLGRFYYM